MVPVEESRSYIQDLQAQLGWLEQNDQLERLIWLLDDLRDASALLAEFPQAGHAFKHQGEEFRKLPLHRAPYVLWYAHAENKVTLIRLFHSSQARPKERLRARRRR